MSKDTNFHTTVIAYLKKILDFKILGATEQTVLNSLQELELIGDKLEGTDRNINVVESFTDGSTDSNVQSLSILFIGDNGTLDGVSVDSGTIFKFSPNKGEDTINSITYTVPNTGDSKVIISYVR